MAEENMGSGGFAVSVDSKWWKWAGAKGVGPGA